MEFMLIVVGLIESPSFILFSFIIIKFIITFFINFVHKSFLLFAFALDVIVNDEDGQSAQFMKATTLERKMKKLI